MTPIETSDGSLTLEHPQHGETYHSTVGAMTEARELFMRKSGFEDFLATNTDQPVRVLDIGLGLGYNALMTIETWLSSPHKADLFLTSIEIDHDLVKALRSGEAAWQKNWSEDWVELATSLQINDEGRYVTEQSVGPGRKLLWELRVKDAKAWHPDALYDFIWHDAFSPANNPTLWTAELFSTLRKAAADEATLVTYSVARQVRDEFEKAGWLPERIDAVGGHKKQWLRCRPEKKKSSQ